MKKTLIALLTTVVLGATAACGGSSSTAEESATLTSKESSSGSGSTLTADDFGERVVAAQVKAGSAHMEVITAMNGQEYTISGDSVLSDNPEDTAISMTMDMAAMGGSGEAEILLVGQVMYMSMGELSGGKFIKFDLTDPSNPLGSEVAPMLEQMDPSAQMKTFSEALTSFKELGDGGRIDGVSTTKYELVVDAEKAMTGQGADASDLPETLTYTMFIGEDDLIRKMTSSVSGADVTVLMSKWGQKVDIEAPSADQITEMPGMSTGS